MPSLLSLLLLSHLLPSLRLSLSLTQVRESDELRAFLELPPRTDLRPMPTISRPRDVQRVQAGTMESPRRTRADRDFDEVPAACPAPSPVLLSLLLLLVLFLSHLTSLFSLGLLETSERRVAARDDDRRLLVHFIVFLPCQNLPS